MLDALTVAAVVDELNTRMIDGRIQQIAHVDELTIALEVYALQRRRWLVLSADHSNARAHITERPVSLDPERITPFLLLLRKYARGGRIVSVSQPRYERILRISIAKPLDLNNADSTELEDDEEVELTHSDLMVEIMGRRSNLILVEANGRIREAIKRVTNSMSRVRPVLPGKPFVPPPPQEKLVPQHASVNDFLRDAVVSEARLDRWLVDRFLAVSPLLAREVVSRAELRSTTPVREIHAPDAARVIEALDDLFAPLDTGIWQPTSYELPDGTWIASPVRLRSIEGVEGMVAIPFASISPAIDAALHGASREDDIGGERHAARRMRLVAEITDAIKRAEQRVRSLREQEALAEEADVWRGMGDAIYASISRIRPRDSELVADDGLTIPLDPGLSATENAQKYFERYRKARSAEQNVPELIAVAENRVTYLNQLLLAARQAEQFDDIEAVRFEWFTWKSVPAGDGNTPRTRAARAPANARRPRAYRSARGDRIWIGRSGPQNDTVAFEIAGPSDLWLHARNMPGAHVILRWNGPNDDVILEHAAALAAWYSAGRGSTTVPVDVTERRHVRKIRGAGPGQVTYRNELTLAVRPRPVSDLGFEPI